MFWLAFLLPKMVKKKSPLFIAENFEHTHLSLLHKIRRSLKENWWKNGFKSFRKEKCFLYISLPLISKANELQPSWMWLLTIIKKTLLCFFSKHHSGVNKQMKALYIYSLLAVFYAQLKMKHISPSLNP